MAATAPNFAPLGNDYLELRAALGTALFALNALATEIHAPAVTLQTLQPLRAGLNEPFRLLVLGESKSGKSSLLNALFGRDFCHIDGLPATDRVSVFKYGEPAREVPVSPVLVESYQPIPFLRDFHLMDTPGASVIDVEHRTAIENFASQADLIFLVFSAVNPWAAAMWQSLDWLQKPWLKQVVCVLQQADLREEREIGAITQHLRQTAFQRLGQNVPFFSVSAKKALLTKTSGLDKKRLWAESGFAAFEAFVDQTLSSNALRRDKLRAVCRTAQTLLKEIGVETSRAERIIQTDRAQLISLGATAAQLKNQSQQQAQDFLRHIQQAFDRCRQEGEHLLREHHQDPWRALRRTRAGERDWEAGFQRQMGTLLRSALGEEIERAFSLLHVELKHVWRQMQDTVQAKFGPEERTHLSADQSKEEEPRLPLPGRQEIAEFLTQYFPAEEGNPVESSPPSGQPALAAYQEHWATRRQEISGALSDWMLQEIEEFYQKLTQLYLPLAMFCTEQEQRNRPRIERVGTLEGAFAKISKQL